MNAKEALLKFEEDHPHICVTDMVEIKKGWVFYGKHKELNLIPDGGFPGILKENGNYFGITVADYMGDTDLFDDYTVLDIESVRNGEFDFKQWFKDHNIEFVPREETVLDKIFHEKGLIEITTNDDEVIYGTPYAMVEEEDDEDDPDSPEHLELVFQIYNENYRVWIKEEDVKSYKKVDKDYVETQIKNYVPRDSNK